MLRMGPASTCISTSNIGSSDSRLDGSPASGYDAFLAALNVIQTCFLAWIAAKQRGHDDDSL